MKKIVSILVALAVALGMLHCGSGATLRWTKKDRQMDKEKQVQAFIEKHVKAVRPLAKAQSLAHYQAAVTGRDEDYEKLKKHELAVSRIYSNAAEFAQIKAWKESGGIEDPRLRRQIALLHDYYLSNQIEPDLMKAMVDLNAKISQRFHTFRGKMDGTTVSLNDINKILTTETDSRRRESAWRAGKQVGDAIVADLLQLARLRNRAARKLGFENYHTMALLTREQDPKEIDRIFEELRELTDEPFAKAKAELDRVLAEKYGMSPDALMPWHYHDLFFQKAPMVFGKSFDLYYKDKDVKALAEKFYAGIGLPVDDVLARSDLYERTGKDQHAFSTDIDREGDVRILCNLKNNEEWMGTLLHELGHAAYSKYHDRREPYLLRDSAHAFCTEAVAMFFGRLSGNAAWMQKMLGLTDAQRAEIAAASEKQLRFQQLIFARWAMVMYHFEKQLYANPDQDLNALWWEMVEKYQRLKRPTGPPDAAWAAKLHFTVAPCYYHNYMLGELLASQFHGFIVHSVLSARLDSDVSYVGEAKVGEFFREKVFTPGITYHWNEMIQRATGEPLTARHFAAQFVK